jgi:hypothetical protein
MADVLRILAREPVPSIVPPPRPSGFAMKTKRQQELCHRKTVLPVQEEGGFFLFGGGRCAACVW